MTSIADKVAHVKGARQTRTHHCHWPHCPLEVPPAMWGCRAHWYAIPKALRDRIWRTYKPGQEASMAPSKAYVEAAQAVQTWIRENAGKGVVIIFGPMASGKTSHATQLMRAHGCKRLVDPWEGIGHLSAGTLALTNLSTIDPLYKQLPHATVVDIKDALVDLELGRA